MTDEKKQEETKSVPAPTLLDEVRAERQLLEKVRDEAKAEANRLEQLRANEMLSSTGGMRPEPQKLVLNSKQYKDHVEKYGKAPAE